MSYRIPLNPLMEGLNDMIEKAFVDCRKERKKRTTAVKSRR